MSDAVGWDQGRREDFAAWARFELDRALAARSGLERQWRDWLAAYRPAEKGEVSFPFVGAAANTYPFVAMMCDPILARFVANIHAPDNLWTTEALNERWIETAKPLQDYLTFLDKHVIHMWETNLRVFDDVVQLGTGIYKSYWRFEQRRTMGYDAQRKRTRVIKTINQPAVEHVRLPNFLLPPEASELDPDMQGGAAWVAEKHLLRPNALRALAEGQSPFLPAMDAAAVRKVLDYGLASLPEAERHAAELDMLSGTLGAQRDRPIELWEIHARFDSTGSRIDDDLVCLFHRETGTVLRSTYEPFPRRPYYAVRYRRGSGFYGIGVCEQATVWQKVISRLMNFNEDKLLLTNAPMLGIKEGANVVADEPIFPGKQWSLGNPKEDLVPFFLTAPGSFDLNSLMTFFQEAGKQRVGITDLQFGAVGSLPSRTPATTVQSLLAEGNTRFDMSMKDARHTLGEIGLSVLQNLQTQATAMDNPAGADYVRLAPVILGSPEGERVAQALTIPAEAIELGVGVSLTATSGTNNKITAQQNDMALLQLYAQVGPQFLQLAQAISMGGPMGETAKQLFQGGAEMLARTLEQFDKRNTDELVPDLRQILAASPPAPAGAPAGMLGGGGGGAATPAPDAGMGALSGGA